jgi:hypothetical protein
MSRFFVHESGEFVTLVRAEDELDATRTAARMDDPDHADDHAHMSDDEFREAVASAYEVREVDAGEAKALCARAVDGDHRITVLL